MEFGLKAGREAIASCRITKLEGSDFHYGIGCDWLGGVVAVGDGVAHLCMAGPDQVSYVPNVHLDAPAPEVILEKLGHG